MCGIFGLVTTKNGLEKQKVKSLVDDLLLLSESRGKDSSGIAFVKGNEIVVYKESLPAHRFIKEQNYRNLLSSEVDQYALIGHARMETNGSFALTYNNQPVVKDGIATIHNGIIVNDSELWKQHRDLRQKYQVDTEVFNSLLRSETKKKSLLESLRSTIKEIKGSFAFACFLEEYDQLLLTTNTGSLFTLYDKAKTFFLFASEKSFVEEIVRTHFGEIGGSLELEQLKPGKALLIDLKGLSKKNVNLQTREGFSETTKLKTPRKITLVGEIITEVATPPVIVSNQKNFKKVEKLVEAEYKKDRELIANLRRCTRCILPETMPFIKFDAEGVCNYCQNYQKREIQGKKSLEDEIAKYRKGTGEADCIVPLSGGRDSCYSLHYAVKELGLKPLAYSYDWGMITDLGRRNQARMTGQLGVEHVLVSADIHKKRQFIRKNVAAWLKKPEIGMIPLFMAGDKQYFYYLNKLRKLTGHKLVLYAGNSLEKTYFKYGFANVEQKLKETRTYDIGNLNTLKLLWYYSKNYLKNPRYINTSVLDTASAFVSSYGIPKDYLYLYNFIPWEERTIENVLIKEYDWELSSDTQSSWRIGDGTASFYNYIYYVMTGLTEIDTFRSNQIREGLITREEAYKLALEENKPRLESMLWYCDTIGIDALRAIEVINSSKKEY